MNNVADKVLNPTYDRNYFGISVSDAGDVNNDGYGDVIVGAYWYYNSKGRAYIYYGGGLMDNIVDVTMTGEFSNGNFGDIVSSIGDVNNDGFDDVIVTAPSANSLRGNAYIFYGGSPMNNSVDIKIPGFEDDGYFGTSACGIGDINNDGFDDILIGAKGYSNYTGRAYLYLGGNPMDTIADAVFTGEGTWNQFGDAVSSAGDVNNDGYLDFMIGANRYSSFMGRVYIYFGGTGIDTTADVILSGEFSANYFGSSITAEDINNDNYTDIIVGAYGYNGTNTGKVYVYYGGNPMDNIADITKQGQNAVDYFGISVSNVGDFNNDGYNDIIIGADGYDPTGLAGILFGSSSFDSTFDVIMEGEHASDDFGYSVSNAGDLNNDGYDDVIVGAYGNNTNGAAYIYFGRFVVDVKDNITLPEKFSLLQNYPNPFNPTTVISYQLPEVSNVVIKVYDILGQEVATLVNEQKPAGTHTIKFDTKSVNGELTSGIYLYRIQAGNYSETKKMIFLK